MQIEPRPVADLVPYAQNSRTHSEVQVQQIAASMREFGFTNPVLADPEGIVAGHGRVLGAALLYSLGETIYQVPGPPRDGQPGGEPIRAGKQFASGRKLGKTHQNVLVFVKGDGKAATQACGPVEFAASLEAGPEPDLEPV